MRLQLACASGLLRRRDGSGSHQGHMESRPLFKFMKSQTSKELRVLHGEVLAAQSIEGGAEEDSVTQSADLAT
eukprot:4060626-Amphidinium_carterae.2